MGTVTGGTSLYYDGNEIKELPERKPVELCVYVELTPERFAKAVIDFDGNMEKIATEFTRRAINKDKYTFSLGPANDIKIHKIE